MPPDRGRLWVRWAVVAWAVVATVVVVRSGLAPEKSSVFPIFAKAGRDWLAGKSPYFLLIEDKPAGLDHYRYCPSATPLFVPWALLPESVGGALWRLLNAAVLLGGAAWWLAAAVPTTLSRSQKALFFLLLAPPAVGSLNNGQANPLVIGLILAAIAACAEGRWTIATLGLTLACLLKIYPVAMVLLLLLVYPRPLAGRLFVALLLAAALPFALQRPDDVLTQWRDWVGLLRTDDRTAWPLEYSYRDAWLLVRLCRLPISFDAYRGVSMAAAAACAAAVVVGRCRGDAEKSVLVSLTLLGTAWMTLFGPATESCTYVLAGPAFAWAVVEAWRRGERRVLLSAAYLLLLVSYIALWFPGGRAVQAYGPQPLAALLLFGGALHAGFARYTRGVPSCRCFPSSVPPSTRRTSSRCSTSGSASSSAA